MTQSYLSGPGLGLPSPQPLYPANLIGAATQPATNIVTLGYGEALTIPPGRWAVSGAPLQFLDPVTNQWEFLGPSSNTFIGTMQSDGQNFRVINPQGIVTTATVTAAGSNYVQATTTITASAGASTYQPIVGGSVALSLTAAGSGYTIAPLVLIAAPPAPGLQATAQATITNGTVSALSVTQAGAGYTVAPAVTILPNPYDPNYGSVTAATATSSLTGAGAITAVFVTWGGTPQASAPTLTVTGAGSGATVTAGYVAESAVDQVILQPI
jgi:hypothetical protein